MELCKNHSLKVFDIIQNNINGGSKQYFISHQNAKYKINAIKINKILKEERGLKLNSINTYKKFIRSIDKSNINY